MGAKPQAVRRLDLQFPLHPKPVSTVRWSSPAFRADRGRTIHTPIEGFSRVDRHSESFKLGDPGPVFHRRYPKGPPPPDCLQGFGVAGGEVLRASGHQQSRRPKRNHLSLTVGGRPSRASGQPRSAWPPADRCSRSGSNGSQTLPSSRRPDSAPGNGRSAHLAVEQAAAPYRIRSPHDKPPFATALPAKVMDLEKGLWPGSGPGSRKSTGSREGLPGLSGRRCGS